MCTRARGVPHVQQADHRARYVPRDLRNLSGRCPSFFVSGRTSSLNLSPRKFTMWRGPFCLLQHGGTDLALCVSFASFPTSVVYSRPSCPKNSSKEFYSFWWPWEPALSLPPGCWCLFLRSELIWVHRHRYHSNITNSNLSLGLKYAYVFSRYINIVSRSQQHH